MKPEREMERVLELAAGFNQQGLAQAARGDHAAAGRAYRAALCDAPGFIDALGNLGNLEIATGAPPVALALYARALAVAPHVPALHLLLATARFHAGDHRKAVAGLRKSLTLAPGYGSAALNLAGMLLQVDASAAAAQVQRALASEPRSQPVLRQVGGIMSQLVPDDEVRRRFFGPPGEDTDPAYHRGDALRRARRGPGYLLIRPWGVGFWGEVDHVAVQLALAEIMGRKPIVLWGGECRYGCPGLANAWESYFLPVSDASLDDMRGETVTFHPPSWTRDNIEQVRFQPQQGPNYANPFGIPALTGLGRPEDIVVGDGYVQMTRALAWAAPGHPLARQSPLSAYRRFFRHVIRPRPDHVARLAEVARGLFSRRPVLAIHFRAQTLLKAAESDGRLLTYEQYFAHVDLFLQRNPLGSLFLLSDVEEALFRFKERYGERLAALARLRLPDHNLIDIGIDRTYDGARLGLEVFDDAYLAAAADSFLGDGGSGVSCAIDHMKDWPVGTITLLRENVFLKSRN